MSKSPLSSPIGTDNPGVLDSLLQSISGIKPTPPDEHADANRRPKDWPKKLWVVDLGEGRYGCLVHPPFSASQTEGLACFRFKKNAVRFLHVVKDSVIGVHKFVELSFEDAVKIVHSRPPSVTTLMLADNPSEPVIHPVR